MTNPYAPPQAVVEDILTPAEGIELADRATRLGAALLDGVVLGAMVYGPLLVGMIAAALQQAGGREPNFVAIEVAFFFALAGFLAWLWITIKCLKANGQSIGKKACHIKIVRSDGSPVSVARVVWLRNAVNMLISLVPFYSFFEVLFIFGNARRCLHDYVADTIVVRA